MRYIPAGAKRDELLGLVRIGITFSQQQHAGRRPGFLHRYITGITKRIKPPATFERLLEELELEAARRNLGADGEAGTPIETVNRVWELVTYHHPKRGRLQVAFGTLRNYFTAAKKDNSRVPLNRESGRVSSFHAASGRRLSIGKTS